jgi:hypothetical protein
MLGETDTAEDTLKCIVNLSEHIHNSNHNRVYYLVASECAAVSDYSGHCVYSVM